MEGESGAEADEDKQQQERQYKQEQQKTNNTKSYNNTMRVESFGVDISPPRLRCETYASVCVASRWVQISEPMGA